MFLEANSNELVTIERSAGNSPTTAIEHTNEITREDTDDARGRNCCVAEDLTSDTA